MGVFVPFVDGLLEELKEGWFCDFKREHMEVSGIVSFEEEIKCVV